MAYFLDIHPTLEQFARESGMPELLQGEGTLNGLLFAPPAKAEPLGFEKKWLGKPFYKLVAQARRRQILRKKRLQSREEPLFSLNPRGVARGQG